MQAGHGLAQHADQRPAVLRDHAQRPGQGLPDPVRGGRGQVGQPGPVRELAGRGGTGLQREPGLADPGRAGERDQPVAGQQREQLAGVGVPADQAGQRSRQGGAGLRLLVQLAADLGQRGPVGHGELAQQGGDMALHRAHRDMQPPGDLPVAQPFGQRGENLGLPPGDARPGQPPLSGGGLVPGPRVNVHQGHTRWSVPGGRTVHVSVPGSVRPLAPGTDPGYVAGSVKCSTDAPRPPAGHTCDQQVCEGGQQAAGGRSAGGGQRICCLASRLLAA